MADEGNRDCPALGFSRRTFMRGVIALGAGSGLLSRSVNADATRRSFTIMDGTERETVGFVFDSGRPGPTTLVTGGMHGDERSGIRAAERIAKWRVNIGKLAVIPYCNQLAVEQGIRGIEYDLNRQFPPRKGGCTAELARAIWAVVERYDPDWMFDLHSSRGIYRSGDGGVGQALFPTWSSPARAAGERTVAKLNETFGLSGDMAYRMGNTLDADRPMLMHRVAGILDRPGYICETTEKAETLAEQVQWQLFAVASTMQQYGQYRVSEPAIELHAETVKLGDSWQRRSLPSRLYDPIVVQKSLTKRGAHPAHTRLRKARADGFECRLEEWNYLDGVRVEETGGIVALNAGLVGPVETGRVTTTDEFTSVTFESSFRTTPLILTKSQTFFGPHPIVTRVSSPSRDGFRVAVKEEDGSSNGNHAGEEVGYVAIEPGTHTLDGNTVEAGVVGDGVAHKWETIRFENRFEDPVFLAAVQSFNGWQTCNLRHRRLTGSSVDIHIQEERSQDAETYHTYEDVGYLVIEG